MSAAKTIILLGLVVLGAVIIGCTHDPSAPSGGGSVGIGGILSERGYPDKSGGDGYVECVATPEIGGNVHVGILLVEFVSTEVSYPQYSFVVHPEFADSVRARMFTDANSVDALYREMSDSTVGFYGDVIGSYVISNDYRADCSPDLRWERNRAAMAAALADSADLSGYDVLMYVYSLDNGCYWAGGLISEAFRVAQHPVLSTPEVCLSSWQYSRLDFAHELGHLMGFGHSSSVGNTYGDFTCIMGENAEYTDSGTFRVPMKHLNAVWKICAGFIGTGEIEHVEGGGTHTGYLAPTEYSASEVVDPPNATAYRAARVVTAGGDLYYLSYRQPRAPFDIDPSGTHAWQTPMNRLNIHHATANGLVQYLAALAQGESYDGSDLRITALSDGLSGDVDYIGYQVEFMEVGPTVTISPASASTANPVADYSEVTAMVYVLNNAESGDVVYAVDVSGPPEITVAKSTDTMHGVAGVARAFDVDIAPSQTFTDGRFTWHVTVRDTSGIQGVGTASGVFIIDTVAPTVPANPSLTIDGGAIDFSWAASYDGTAGTTSYDVERNGTIVASVAAGGGPTYHDTGVVPNNTYTYRARAHDGVGNVSAWSDSVSTSFACGYFSVSADSLTIYRNATKRRPPVNIAFPFDVTNVDQASCGSTNFEYYMTTVAGGGAPVPATPSSFNVAAGATATVTATMNFATVPQEGKYDGAVKVSSPNGTYEWNSVSYILDMTAPSVPVSLTAHQNGCDVNLMWGASTDALAGLSHYIVKRDGVEIGQAVQEYFTDELLQPTPGTTYSYTIVAVDRALNESSASSAANVTVPTISISNVTTSFDAGTCTVTVEWDTNTASDSLVDFGPDCNTLGGSVAVAGDVLHHSVACDVSSLNGTFAFEVVSAAGCVTSTSSCQSVSIGACQ